MNLKDMKTKQTDIKKLTAEVKKYAIILGADLVGIANIERWEHCPPELSASRLFPEAKSVVVIAMHIPDACMELGNEPSPYDMESSVTIGAMNHRLNRASFMLARFIEGKGFASLPIAATGIWNYRAYGSIKKDMVPDISHIHAAVAAGLGEFTHTGLFTSPEFGTRVRLTSIITAAELMPDPLYDGEPLCDKCLICEKFCIPQAMTKEIDGESVVRIEDKVYRYPNRNYYRCGWYEDSHFSIATPIPEKIDSETIIATSKKYGTKQHFTGQGCYKYCLPPQLRYFDRNYANAPRRKKSVPPGDTPEQRKILSGYIRETALKGGAVSLGICPSSAPEYKMYLVDVKAYLPDVDSVIVIGIDPVVGPVSERNYWENIDYLNLTYIEFDIAQYLERQGYSVIMKTSFPADIAALVCIRDAEANRNRKYSVMLTSARLEPLKEDFGYSGLYPKGQKEVLTSKTVKEFALQKGADLTGIASVDRLSEVASQINIQLSGNQPYFTVDYGTKGARFIHYNSFGVQHRLLQFKKPQDYFTGAKSVIVLGLHYPDVSIDKCEKEPTYKVGPYTFAQYQTVFHLGIMASEVVRLLKSYGYKAVPSLDLSNLASSLYRIMGFSPKCSPGIIPDTTANRFEAVAAGLGEIGWNGMPITASYGIRQRFIAIATDADIEQDQLYNGISAADICSSCGYKCTEACPTGALSARDKVEFTLEGRRYQYSICDRLRCDWAKRYALVGDEGPKYTGSQTDILPPDDITPENLIDALKQFDPLQKDRSLILEKCVAACFAHEIVRKC